MRTMRLASLGGVAAVAALAVTGWLAPAGAQTAAYTDGTHGTSIPKTVDDSQRAHHGRRDRAGRHLAAADLAENLAGLIAGHRTVGGQVPHLAVVGVGGLAQGG